MKEPLTIATYRCSACGRQRQYGHIRPDTVFYEPRLGCANCRRNTPHRFASLMNIAALGDARLSQLRARAKFRFTPSANQNRAS